MVTGDNIHTAKHIARDCGILDESKGGFAMEGPEFRAIPREEMMKKLPNLQVCVLQYMNEHPGLVSVV
jgi:P-type Ca2+ transporter type 2C